MKYAPNQPVWVIGHCSRKWHAAVVLGLDGGESVSCQICWTTIKREQEPIYLVALNDFPGRQMAAAESMLRPRDPGQFTPADKDGELLGLPELSKGVVK